MARDSDHHGDKPAFTDEDAENGAAPKALNHLRAWREFRKLSQADLAAKVGTTGPVISLLESGQRGLSDKWLRRLAHVLRTRPGFLLDFDPSELDLGLMEEMMRLQELPDAGKADALEVLRATIRAVARR